MYARSLEAAFRGVGFGLPDVPYLAAEATEAVNRLEVLHQGL